MDGLRMVKVDNWAAFFLQKLQALYIRGDFTDLTLQFHTNECIKVHRLVLNTCTEYFEKLIRQTNATNHMRLPPHFQSDVVVPIINFMYSGRLEFRPELHQRLYNTAKILNMQILTKLLDTHAGKPTPAPRPKHIYQVPSVAPTPVSPTSNSIKSESERADFVPGKRLPIWKKRSTPSSISLSVSTKPITEEPAKPTRFEWPEDGDSDSAPLLYSSTFDDISYDSVPIVKSINSIVQSALPPVPSQPLVQLPQQKMMPSATFESVYQSANLKKDSSPRPHGTQAVAPAAKKARVDIDDVKELVQEQEVRKTLLKDDAEQENEDLDDFLPVSDHDAEDFEDEEITNESSDPLNTQTSSSASSGSRNPKPILKVHDSPDTSRETTPSKKVRFHLEPKVHAVSTTSVSAAVQPPSSSDGIDAGPSSDKPAVESASPTVQNSQLVASAANIPKKDVDPGANMYEIRAPAKRANDGSTIQSKTPNATNHAKIIAEVLKKYPDLVKNNKNIRLKIIQKDGSPAVSVEKSGGPGENKPKVSYMVVKADQPTKSKGLTDTNSTAVGPHNTTGPWLCSACDPEKPITFESYFNYRKHLQEVHQEKIDVRICEHCGIRASKRNLLMYHMYKIHGIAPPSNCNFPKCDQCDHIALSEALLSKHKNIHSGNKEFMCRMCHTSFKSYPNLQSHLQNNQRCNPRKKSFKCPVCAKLFQLQINLKNHIRAEHPNLKLLEDMAPTEKKMTEEPEVSQAFQELVQQTIQQQQQQQVQQQHDQLQHHPQLEQQPSSLHSTHQQHTHVISQEQLNQQVLQAATGLEVQSEVHPQAGISTQPQTTYILPPGVTILTDNNQATLMPSTEAEALSNVASGIAASLGVADSMVVSDQGQHQTFIVVDKNSLIQIPGPTGSHEYIVPDLMANDMNQSVGVYTPGHLSQLVQYTTAGGLQQPVAVSTTDQGLMTITTVNANGSIVNHTVPQQSTAPIMETAMMQIPQGHLQDHAGGEITMILTDHAYSEGMVRENGAVMQTTSVPVSMNMVPTSAVVSVVSAVPSIPTTVPTSRSLNDNGVHHVMAPMEVTKDVGERDCALSASVGVETDQQESDQPTQKMAELASDWDDVDENEDCSGVHRSVDDSAEDTALPSRPSIVLKGDLDGDDLPENLPIKMT